MTGVDCEALRVLLERNPFEMVFQLNRRTIAALLAKSDELDALVAEIEAAPVVTAGSWIRNYMASANRIEYGSRVRLLLVREGVDGS